MGHIGKHTNIDKTAFIHESAYIYGKVTIAENASVWINVAMRSEAHEIRIGARSNIQDFVMIHEGFFTPTIIGQDCSITHHATLHGCTLGDKVLVGINATIMDGAKIGSNSIVAGNSLVRENAEFPENSVIGGVPAKLITTRDSGDANLINARFYQRNAQNYSKDIERLSAEDIQFVMGNGK